jgi:hypothetical protein
VCVCTRVRVLPWHARPAGPLVTARVRRSRWPLQSAGTGFWEFEADDKWDLMAASLAAQLENHFHRNPRAVFEVQMVRSLSRHLPARSSRKQGAWTYEFNLERMSASFRGRHRLVATAHPRS